MTSVLEANKLLKKHAGSKTESSNLCQQLEAHRTQKFVV